MPKVTVTQGEAMSLPFRIRDMKTGRWLDLTGATFLLSVKGSPEDADAVISKVDSDFDKGGVASGYLNLFLTAYDTWQNPGTYAAELRAIKSGTPAPIAKYRFDFVVLKAVTPNDWELAPTGISSLEAVGTPVVAII